jgi:hypothetical protein
MKLTKPQQKSLLTKWSQDDQGLSFLKFRRSVVRGLDETSDPAYVVVRWCHMWLCIEIDGYTHS